MSTLSFAFHCRPRLRHISSILEAEATGDQQAAIKRERLMHVGLSCRSAAIDSFGATPVLCAVIALRWLACGSEWGKAAAYCGGLLRTCIGRWRNAGLGVPGNYQCMLCLPNFSNQHDKQGSSEAIAKLFQ
jgi:hypothetical protein